jgi:hypothetical protein
MSLYIPKQLLPTREILIIYPIISSLMYIGRLCTVNTRWIESLLMWKGSVVSSGKAGALLIRLPINSELFGVAQYPSVHALIGVHGVACP